MPESIDPVVVGGIVGAGGVGMWFKEWRKGRKDTYQFALSMMAQQNERIDKLIKDLGKLEGKLSAQESAMDLLKTENEALKHENERLKTALGEHGRTS